MTKCLICGETLLAEYTLALGPLVACNRFEKQASTGTPSHPLSISECPACNLVQLSKYPPADFVRPRHPWIRYNEPSAHLDDAVTQFVSILPSEPAKSAIGVGPFDAALLDRMAPLGFDCKKLDLSAHLSSESGGYPYLESIQALLRPKTLNTLASTQGTAQIVSCRYLLEHSHNPVESLRGLGELMRDQGLLVIEVPDSSKFLSRMDYSFIWEEHICYFTEVTFKACARTAGFEIVQFLRYPGVLEDVLLFVLRAARNLPAQEAADYGNSNSATFIRYQSSFSDLRAQYQEILQAIVARGKRVAIFGAGHQSVMFINALGLASLISCAIDDAPEKLGHFIPGTTIPIVPSEYLATDPGLEVCLLGVSPTIEEKIRSKCADFLNRGGRMFTIFPGSGSSTLVSGKT